MNIMIGFEYPPQRVQNTAGEYESMAFFKHICYTYYIYPKSHKEIILKFIDEELRTFCKDGSYLCDEVGFGPTKLNEHEFD